MINKIAAYVKHSRLVTWLRGSFLLHLHNFHCFVSINFLSFCLLLG